MAKTLSPNGTIRPPSASAPGRIAELPDALAAAGIKRPLFVTDPGLAKLPVVA